jgi:hypothetical protein
VIETVVDERADAVRASAERGGVGVELRIEENEVVATVCGAVRRFQKLTVVGLGAEHGDLHEHSP